MATILLVDDNELILKSYRFSLEADLVNVKFLTAANEDEAIMLINGDNEIDVVITDLNMKTGSGGMKVLEAAKAKDPLIMVILITANGADLDRKSAFESGAFDCLEKGAVGVKTANEISYKTKTAIYIRETARSLIQSESKMNSFKKYFDPMVFDKIKKNPDLLTPRIKTITIIFWDIRGFSALSESLKSFPALIAEFLKEHHDICSKVIFRNSGVLDKFMGDGVMALFGAFDEIDMADKNAHCAIQAAIDFRSEFDLLYLKWKKIWEKMVPGKIDIGIGCGIHTGEALVGNLGTDTRDHFTAIGPHVNLTQRIESSANKGEIRFSSTTRSRIDMHFEIRQIDTLINPKNIQGNFDIFEIAE